MIDAKTKNLLHLQSLEFRATNTDRMGWNEEELKKNIQRLRSGITIQMLKEYDTRKRRYGNQSVVPVHNGICSGCQVTLSLRTRRLAKYTLVECEHCGRLLYNSERQRRLRVQVFAV